ncbi:MAG: hypothetical protein OEZ06_18670 [Myxococcales bacterium]|nr:hypothetical protein [Myxococcales bacterium]
MSLGRDSGKSGIPWPGPRRVSGFWLQLILVLTPLGVAPRLQAQLSSDHWELDGTTPLLLAVDGDDDDEDGVIDGEQLEGVPVEDLVEVVVVGSGSSEAVTLSALGGLRLIRRGRVMPSPLRLEPDELPAPIFLQAAATASLGRPLSLVVEEGKKRTRYPVEAVALTLLDADNRPLDFARSTLALSHRVTNDASLPRRAGYPNRSPDPHNIRVQIQDPSAQGKRLEARVEAVAADSGKLRSSLEVTLVRPRVKLPFRSPFIRLVGDAVDAAAAGVEGQVLRVGLRDRVRIVYGRGNHRASQELRVGRPGNEKGPHAARQVGVRLLILRSYAGGPPVIGVDDLSALRVVREEVAIANEIWLQCHLTFGAPAEAAVSIVDPPPATLISVSDGDGLPAAGGGEIRFRIEGRSFGPVLTRPGAKPADTGLALAEALRAEGFDASVTVNPETVFGAGQSADVLVRKQGGQFVRIAPIRGVPLSSDPRQRLRIGRVDLGDGLEEFDNMTATSGTLEERTLIKAFDDGDPATIDLYIVNRFTHGTRQGEAFIEGSAGPIANTVVLDRNGLRQRQTAWTMAHEIGHVLLNQPLHPDNVGADEPALLMDSDNNRGTVNGPKRLSGRECDRVRHESGVRAVPPLLQPYDARPQERQQGPAQTPAQPPK